MRGQRVPETGGRNGQDNRPIQQIAPGRPYPGTLKVTEFQMDNNPRGNYCARYANIPKEFKPETVRIGNQELITLDSSQPCVDPALAADKGFAAVYNFSFLADFLSKNDKIEYIVDVGCGGGELSLLMQNYLKDLGFQIKVIPVDVLNIYADIDDDIKPIPINIIPAQEIADASPSTTLFTAIHPYTGSSSEARRLSREIAQGITDFYITTLIKNNPGCFVLTTEDPHFSSPQDYIPPELVYTKHYKVFPNPCWTKHHESKALRRAKAAAMNAENSAIYRLNQLLAKLPAQRDSYLALITAIKDQSQPEMLQLPEQCWPDIIFRVYLGKILSMEVGGGVDIYENITSNLEKNGFGMDCWHVYRQDVNASEFESASPSIKNHPEPEKAASQRFFCKIL